MPSLCLTEHSFKMGRLFFLIFLTSMTTAFNGWCQSFYWVGFTDKENSPWSLSEPEEYLSQRAIERRERQHVEIDSLDLPVNPSYISQVLRPGVTLVHSSKWLNGITVGSEISSFAEDVAQLPFVREVQLTKRNIDRPSLVSKFIEPHFKSGIVLIDSLLYGESSHQVFQINAHFLHNQNYKGQGMHIAVLDAGFYGVDEFAAFDSLWAEGRILGTRDFVEGDDYVFDGHFHGMSVLSAMAGNVPGKLLGTAPKASYWLLRSEDVMSEFLIEEDNWVAAAEFADSAGVDVINSSLGYSTFDDPEMNHTYEDMDGQTTRVTRGANIAASRGMLVVASAGNEGRPSNTWKYIIAPSDGEKVIAVGAVNKEGIPAPFTSYGPASDGDVKPNVSAVGWNTILQRSNGEIGTGNGTSYSSPVMAGAAAALWQANEQATADRVKAAIEQSAHLFPASDSLLGYGIPDLKIAHRLLKAEAIGKDDIPSVWTVYPNPVTNYIVLQKKVRTDYGNVMLSFYTLDGRLVYQKEVSDASKILLTNLHRLPSGLLLLQIRADDATEVVKISKGR